MRKISNKLQLMTEYLISMPQHYECHKKTKNKNKTNKKKTNKESLRNGHSLQKPKTRRYDDNM